MLNEKEESLRMTGKYASMHIIFMLAAKTNQTPNFRELTAMDSVLMSPSVAACGFCTWHDTNLETSPFCLIHHLFDLRILCIQPLDGEERVERTR